MLDFPDRILKRSYLKEYTRKMVLLGEKLSGSLGIAVKVRVCGGNFVVPPQNYPHIYPQPRQLPENQLSNFGNFLLI